MHPFPRLLVAMLLCLAAGLAHAAVVTRVDVEVRAAGDDALAEEMTGNVRGALSLVEAVGHEVSQARLDYLVGQAEDETRQALEPFGYYSPQVNVERLPGGAGALAVRVRVQPGAPVRVRGFNVGIEGAGGSDHYLQEELDAFTPQPGNVFAHAAYSASKVRISRRLAERGYFDADFLAHRVEVTRADHAADIDLRWDSGPRYDMGPIRFEQEPQAIRESLLRKLVYWQPGEYYHQGRLERLRTSLAKLDYFSSIDIEPHPDQASDGQVPVTVSLVPARRSIYTAGVSYGTDSGAGVRGSVERRYLNSRGHKALAEVDWAVHRKTATLQYRVPAFAWLDGWYTASLQGADEQSEFVDTRRLEFVASRSGEVNKHLTAIAALHALRERWRFLSLDPAQPLADYRYASLLFPELRAEYIDADDRLYPRDGLGATLMLRGGVQGAGSDASFAQLHASARWFKGLGPSDRLIVRGELGHTVTDTLADIPLSLRFFAGGDRSVRGYGWREIGPRIGTFAIGAKNVATASVEYERYVTAQWGGAVFVDTGSAFNDRPDWRTGVGVGLRWRSPVGPVRVDIARGLDGPQSGFTLHLNIGADL